MSDQVEGTDPLKDGLVLRRSVALGEGEGLVGGGGSVEWARRERTARVVNAVSDRMREVLREHPLNVAREKEGKAKANVVLLRGCGSLLELGSFEERHGLRACMYWRRRLCSCTRRGHASSTLTRRSLNAQVWWRRPRLSRGWESRWGWRCWR